MNCESFDLDRDLGVHIVNCLIQIRTSERTSLLLHVSNPVKSLQIIV